MRPAVVAQLALTTLREHLRSREALFWTYGFPVVVAVVLGLAFGDGAAARKRVAVVAAPNAAELRALVDGEPWLDVEVLAAEPARQALAAGEIDLVLGGTLAEPAIWRDERRDASQLAYLTVERRLQQNAGRRDPITPEVRAANGRSERYIDFLLPGLIALNLLGAGLWGVGYTLVDMRIKSLLRRLVVAPMQRSEFLLAFLVSRLGLVVLDAGLILLFGVLVFGVPVHGSPALLFGLFVLSGVAFSGLGLLVAARPRTVEGVSGTMNLVMLPMWLLGGSFFGTTAFPSYFRPLIDVLPITHVNDALRAVMLDGAGVGGVWPHLLFLAAFTVVAFAVSLRVFRWT